MKIGLKRYNKQTNKMNLRVSNDFLDIWIVDWVVGDEDPEPEFSNPTQPLSERRPDDTSTAPDRLTLRFPNVLEWTDGAGEQRRAGATPFIIKTLFRDGLVMVQDKQDVVIRRRSVYLDEIDNYRHAIDSMVLKGMMAAVEWAETMQEQMLRRCADKKIWVGWIRRSSHPLAWDPVVYDVPPYPLTPVSDITVRHEGDRYTRSEQARPLLLEPVQEKGRPDVPAWILERDEQYKQRELNHESGMKPDDKGRPVPNVQHVSDVATGWVPERDTKDAKNRRTKFKLRALASEELTWDYEVGRAGFDDITFPELGVLCVSVPEDFTIDQLSPPTKQEQLKPFMGWFDRAVMPFHRKAVKQKLEQISKTSTGKLIHDTVTSSDASLAHWLDLAASDNGTKVVPPCVMEKYLLLTGRERSDDPHSSLTYYRPVSNKNNTDFVDTDSVKALYRYASDYTEPGMLATDTGDVLGGYTQKQNKMGYISTREGWNQPGVAIIRRRRLVELYNSGALEFS